MELTAEQRQERDLAMKKYINKKVKEFKKELIQLALANDFPFVNGVLKHALLDMESNVSSRTHFYQTEEEGGFISWVQRYYNPKHLAPSVNPYLLDSNESKPAS